VPDTTVQARPQSPWPSYSAPSFLPSSCSESELSSSAATLFLLRSGRQQGDNGVQGVPEAQGAVPEGPVVAGGGREAARLHPPLRPWLLERSARQGW
jgi:hypothetical protein